jgi:hypothetical protein
VLHGMRSEAARVPDSPPHYSMSPVSPPPVALPGPPALEPAAPPAHRGRVGSSHRELARQLAAARRSSPANQRGDAPAASLPGPPVDRDGSSLGMQHDLVQIQGIRRGGGGVAAVHSFAGHDDGDFAPERVPHRAAHDTDVPARTRPGLYSSAALNAGHDSPVTPPPEPMDLTRPRVMQPEVANGGFLRAVNALPLLSARPRPDSGGGMRDTLRQMKAQRPSMPHAPGSELRGALPHSECRPCRVTPCHAEHSLHASLAFQSYM